MLAKGPGAKKNGYVQLGLTVSQAATTGAWDIWDHCYTKSGSYVSAGDCAFSVISNAIGIGLSTVTAYDAFTKRGEFDIGVYNDTLFEVYQRAGYRPIYNNNTELSGINKRGEAVIYDLAYDIVHPSTDVTMRLYSNQYTIFVAPTRETNITKRNGFDGYQVSTGGVLAGCNGFCQVATWDDALGWAQYTPSGYNAPWWNIWQLSSAPDYYADFGLISVGSDVVNGGNIEMWLQIENSPFGLHQPAYTQAIQGEWENGANGAPTI